MILATKKVTDLVPADYNPRKALKPGDAEYEKLKRSLEQFGYVEPIIWNATTGHVVGGHQRLTVLRDLGVTEVDCVVVEMDREKEKALNLSSFLVKKIDGEWLIVAETTGLCGDHLRAVCTGDTSFSALKL